MSLSLENLEQFEKAYKLALKEKKDSFIFKEEEVLTTYARYVIEYLKNVKKTVKWEDI